MAESSDDAIVRCPWAGADPLMIAYHDQEWGVPVHDDRLLFEFLILEGAQAGLSWRTVLHKREAYRKAFANFDVERVARFGEREVTKLMNDEGIIRNRLKIASTITNAKTVLAVRKTWGSLDAYLWRFVNGKPIDNRVKTLKDVPAKTAVSDAMSKALLKDGFKFVGSTICYAFMQATGMVNDHLVTCFRHQPAPLYSGERATSR
jgi:DNA-3-methyladenine glycosylase I